MMIISERKYEEVMKTRVEPYLKKIREDYFFNGEDGAELHSAAFVVKNPKAVIVISHGFSESAEKYSELAYYFTTLGYSVYIPEHRGHGRSHRENDKFSVVHTESFNSYVNDFNAFMKAIIEPLGLDCYLFAHSMGGAIGALYMEEYPEKIKKAVLSSPMIAPKRGFLSLNSAKNISGFMKFKGKGNKALIVGSSLKKTEPAIKRSASSVKRSDYYGIKRKRSLYLRTNAPSFSWSYEALGVTAKILNPRKLKEISSEVLLLQAGRDKWVLNEPQTEFIKGIKNGKLIRFSNSRHEIYRESNPTLKKYMSVIMRFYDKGEDE